MKILKHVVALKSVMCFLLMLGLSLYSFAQNNNSSSTKTVKKPTKQKTTKKIDLDLDLTGVDELLRDMKEWPYVGAQAILSFTTAQKL